MEFLHLFPLIDIACSRTFNTYQEKSEGGILPSDKFEMIFSSRCFFQKNKRTNSTLLLVDLCSFVFRKKVKTPKRHLEINWPLVVNSFFLKGPFQVKLWRKNEIMYQNTAPLTVLSVVMIPPPRRNAYSAVRHAAVEMIIKLELLHAVALLVFFTLACWPHWPCLWRHSATT